MSKVYSLLKKAYYAIPHKRRLFDLVKRVRTPSLRVASYLKFKGAFEVRTGAGGRFVLVNDDSTIPTRIYWHGLDGHEPTSLKVWRDLARGGTIIDVGANFGLFGILAKCMAPGAMAVFVEALERNCRRIERNLRANGFEGLVVPNAAGRLDGIATFYDMDAHDNTIGSLDEGFVRRHRHHSNVIPVAVPIARLDTIARDHGLDRITMMKIDVEGAEADVLHGAVGILRRFKPHLLIEVTSAANAAAINELLADLDLGYHVYTLDEVHGVSRVERVVRSGSRNILLSQLADLAQ